MKKLLIFALALLIPILTTTAQASISNRFSLVIQTGHQTSPTPGSLLHNMILGFFIPLGRSVTIQTAGTFFTGNIDHIVEHKIETYGLTINFALVLKSFSLKNVDISLGPAIVYSYANTNTFLFDIPENVAYLSSSTGQSTFSFGLRSYYDLPITDSISLFTIVDFGMNQVTKTSYTYDIQGIIQSTDVSGGLMTFGISYSGLGIRIRL